MRNLLTDTKALLSEQRMPLTKMAVKIGVSERWLYKLKTGEVENPRINEVQRAYDWLRTHKPKKVK